MKIKHILFLTRSFASLFLFATLFTQGVTAQGKSTDATKSVSDSVVILPIPPTELIVEYEKTAELLTRKGKLQISDEDLEEYDRKRDTILNSADSFLETAILQSMEGANIRELDNARYLVALHIDQIEDFQMSMTKRTRDIMDASIELGQNKKISCFLFCPNCYALSTGQKTVSGRK